MRARFQFPQGSVLTRRSTSAGRPPPPRLPKNCHFCSGKRPENDTATASQAFPPPPPKQKLPAYLGREGCPPCDTYPESFAAPHTPRSWVWRARIRPPRLPPSPVLNSRPAAAVSRAPPPPRRPLSSAPRPPAPRLPRQRPRRKRKRERPALGTLLLSPPQRQQSVAAAHDERKRPRRSDRIRSRVIIPRDIAAAAAGRTAKAGWTRPRGASHPSPLLEYN